MSTPSDTGHEAVVIQFRRDFLGQALFDAPVFAIISMLLERASRGVSFCVPDEPLRRLEMLPPAEKTIELLGLLIQMSHQEAPVLAPSRSRRR